MTENESLATEIRYIRMALDDLIRRFAEAEKERVTRSELYQASHSEMRNELGRVDLRIETLEKKSCQAEDDLKRIDKTLERFGVVIGAVSSIGLGMMAWLVSQLLGGVP